MTCSGTGGIGKASVVITVNPVTPVPAPTVSLTSSTTTITAGSTSTLVWSSKNAASCVKSGGWSGTGGTSGSGDVSPTATTTYSVACSGSGGTAQSSAKVSVATPTPAAEPTVQLVAGATTITSGNATTLTWSSTNSDSCLASGGWTGTKSDDGTSSVSPTSTSTFTLACSGAGGTATATAKVTVNAAPTGPAVAAGTSWIYYNGQFDWPGDWPFSSTTNYADTSGGPMSGGDDLKVTLTAQYGGWIPWAQNFSFNSAPYTKLTISLKPTMANQKWTLGFVKVGDVPVGIWLDLSNYGPAPVAGQWGTYTLPLSDLGVQGQDVYKFVLQDSNGSVGNSWYVDNVGFVP